MKSLPLLALLALPATSLHAQAATAPLSVLIDKGGLKISQEKISKPYELTYELPEGCIGTQVTITESNGVVRVIHQGLPCPTGAKFKLTVARLAPLSVQLNAGSIELTGGEDSMALLSELEAGVTAGAISSSVARVKVSRSANFAGAEASYTNPKAKRSGRLRLRVKAGNISF